MAHAGPKSTFRPFLVLLALGAVGVVAALPVSLALVRDVFASLPDAPTLSPSATLALAIVNPLVLVAVATLAGLVFAPRVGLRSLLAEGAAGRPFDARAWRAALPVALAVGAAVGAVLVVLDALTASLLVGELAGQTVTADRSLAVTVAGVLYGGVTEEIILRWGLMSLLARVFARAARLLSPADAGATTPPWAAMIAAIVVSALLFGLSHLPALAAHDGAFGSPDAVALILQQREQQDRLAHGGDRLVLAGRHAHPTAGAGDGLLAVQHEPHLAREDLQDERLARDLVRDLLTVGAAEQRHLDVVVVVQQLADDLAGGHGREAMDEVRVEHVRLIADVSVHPPLWHAVRGTGVMGAGHRPCATASRSDTAARYARSSAPSSRGRSPTRPTSANSATATAKKSTEIAAITGL